MALGSLSGFARASVWSPTAQGVCDRCGFRYPLSRLRKQFEWGGKGLIDTGLLVCGRTCDDRPWEQLRALILPPDPTPVRNPRPDVLATPPAFRGGPPPTSPGNQGFSQWVLGAPVPGDYPTTKPAVLSTVASISGVATPESLSDASRLVLRANSTFTLLPANAARTWLLIYNPSALQLQFSTGTALWGMQTNFIIGPGEAWFWATAQGLGAVYQGAITAIGLYAGVPIWAWDSPTFLYNDGGILGVQPAAAWPASPAGLLPGALWSNGGVATIVPPTSPHPPGALLFFPPVSAAALLSVGGGNLLTEPGPAGSGQLYNLSNEVAVS